MIEKLLEENRQSSLQTLRALVKKIGLNCSPDEITLIKQSMLTCINNIEK